MEFRQKFGPWAIVAGASEGLGAAFAESLARRGINVVLIARRAELLRALADRLTDTWHIETKVCPFDLGHRVEVDRFLESLEVPVGLLVYNAAYAPVGSFTEMAPDALQRVIDINVATPVRIARQVAGPMSNRGHGGIVLMSSLAGAQGTPRIATYAASKAFNAVLAEGLWEELRHTGVDVITCRAGAIRTPGYQSMNTREAPGTLDPAVVAEQTLARLGQGPSVVPGLVNRIAYFVMTRLLPRRTAIDIMARNTRDLP